MNARTLLGSLATLILVTAIMLSGVVIWAATAGTDWVARGGASTGVPKLVMAVVVRALSLVL